MSQNFEELYKALQQEYEQNKKDNDEICKEYEMTIQMLSDSMEQFKAENENLKSKLGKLEDDQKKINKEKENLIKKNKDKMSDIELLNKKNEKLIEEYKKIKEQKNLINSKIVTLETDNDHYLNKIRECEANIEDLNEQLENALEENITLQTEFEIYKQNTTEQLYRKDEDLREIKKDNCNKERIIQKIQRGEDFDIKKLSQKLDDERKAFNRVKRRLTLVKGSIGYNIGKDSAGSARSKNSEYSNNNAPGGKSSLENLNDKNYNAKDNDLVNSKLKQTSDQDLENLSSFSPKKNSGLKLYLPKKSDENKDSYRKTSSETSQQDKKNKKKWGIKSSQTMNFDHLFRRQNNSSKDLEYNNMKDTNEYSGLKCHNGIDEENNVKEESGENSVSEHGVNGCNNDNEKRNSNGINIVSKVNNENKREFNDLEITLPYEFTILPIKSSRKVSSSNNNTNNNNCSSSNIQGINPNIINGMSEQKKKIMSDKLKDMLGKLQLKKQMIMKQKMLLNKQTEQIKIALA